MLRVLACIGLITLGLSGKLFAESATVAVASNFKATLQQLQSAFEQQTGHQLTLVSAASGALYQQIRFGAPFDLLLSADSERPQQLAASGQGVASSRRTYALGQLALAGRGLSTSLTIAEQLQNLQGKLALANPRHAPYGIAAQQSLEHLSLAEPLADQQVLGANILQAYQFVTTGNAELGLVALPLLHQDQHAPAYLPIPSHWHQPIEQQLILLQRGQNNAAAQALIAFINSTEARRLISKHGYQLPEGEQ
mgnify:CR=1 FL=1